MFNISPYCCRVLIENISKNSECVSLKPFILLSTYASAIYQVVLWEDLAALKPLQVIPGEPIVRFQEPHSLWHFLSPQSQTKSVGQILTLTNWHKYIIHTLNTHCILKVLWPSFCQSPRQRENQLGPNIFDALFSIPNLYEFYREINDNWQAQNKGL